MLKHLGMTEKSDKDEQLPITRSMDHLLQTYKKQLPKNSVGFIGMSNEKGYYSVTFRGEKATIKIPVSTQGSCYSSDLMLQLLTQGIQILLKAQYIF